jgi:hypothetical protein
MLIKILGVIIGMLITGAGVYIMEKERKKVFLGPVVAVTGLLIFVLSLLILFVKDFFN